MLLLRPRDPLATFLVRRLRGRALRFGAVCAVFARVGAGSSTLLRRVSARPFARSLRVAGGVALRNLRDGHRVVRGLHHLLVRGVVSRVVVRQRDAARFDVFDVLLEEVEATLEADHGLPGDVRAELRPAVFAVEVAELRERVLEELVVLDAAIGREEGGRERRREGGQSLTGEKKAFSKKKAGFAKTETLGFLQQRICEDSRFETANGSGQLVA